MKHDPFQPTAAPPPKLPRKPKDAPIAKGFRRISGEKRPPAGKWWVQLRNGWIDHHGPWPSKTDRPWWKHTGSEWDVIAVKRAD